MWTGRGRGLAGGSLDPGQGPAVCFQSHESTPKAATSIDLQLFPRVVHTDIPPACLQGRLMGPCSCQRHAATLTRATRQLGHVSFPQAQIWSVGIMTTCPDNPATHTQCNFPGLTNHTWEFSHLHKPPKWPLCSLPTHPPHSSNFPVSLSLGAQCGEHGPSVTVPRSRHMTITVHLPLTATSHIQPRNDAVPDPGCLLTETSYSQETLHL